MLNHLWLVPLLPLSGFLLLVVTEGKLNKTHVPWIGVGSVGLSALLVAGIGVEMLNRQPEQRHFHHVLWQWMAVGGFKADVALYLDSLSLTMLFVVTGIGFLIHVYSAGYMAGDPGYSRFFAYMNLFVSAMLILVLADNLALLYLGWEGVGLCSYLLIGFWYDKPKNGYAARKAFIVTRVGDTALLLGLFLLFTELGTLDIQAAMTKAGGQWPAGSTLPTAAALLLLGGAIGKSAQLPLHVWLPDAMAGPTPVSALIHAATMVTAGVYLIARTHVLFMLAPDVQSLVAVIGAATVLMAGLAALAQTDIKRILAYSTISQIGYMFLALGVGAWSAAIFHLMTHAFFKALLFMSAGAVVASLHHQQDIFKMGGLWRQFPIAFWSFLTGTAALVALPLTSGYYSKHEILLAAFAAGRAGPWLWGIGVAGAILTALYSFRLILVAFFGPRRSLAHERLSPVITLPLAILAALSIFGGLLEVPEAQVLPPTVAPKLGPFNAVPWITGAAPFIGILAALLRYGPVAPFSHKIRLDSRIARSLHRWCFHGFGFDWLYARLLLLPYLRLAQLNRNDVLDSVYRGIVTLVRYGHRLLASSQTGRLRWYAAAMVLGTVLAIARGFWA